LAKTSTEVRMGAMLMAFEPDRPRCHHVRSMPQQPQPGDDQASPRAAQDSSSFDDEGVEIVDGLPVLAEVRTLEPASPASLPAVQAAAAAATGFVAGAATLAIARRIGSRRLARTRVTQRRGQDGLPIVGTRSFLIDIHMLAKPGE
jgi:hypothetical protein